jgi:hypothetical protein
MLMSGGVCIILNPECTTGIGLAHASLRPRKQGLIFTRRKLLNLATGLAAA